jgi:hypothetical protein
MGSQSFWFLDSFSQSLIAPTTSAKPPHKERYDDDESIHRTTLPPHDHYF